MIARRVSQNTPDFLGIREAGDSVEGTAKLEGPGALQAFRLDEKPRSEFGVEPVIAQKRRAHSVTGEPLRRVQNVGVGGQVYSMGHGLTPALDGVKNDAIFVENA